MYLHKSAQWFLRTISAITIWEINGWQEGWMRGWMAWTNGSIYDENLNYIIYIHWIITLYTWNYYDVICLLCLNNNKKNQSWRIQIIIVLPWWRDDTSSVNIGQAARLLAFEYTQTKGSEPWYLPLFPRNCGQKHDGRARRGVVVGPKVTFLGLWPEKVGKLKRKPEAFG